MGTKMSIVTPQRVPPPLCNPGSPPKTYGSYPLDFDMIDTPEQIAHWPLLRKPLEACASILLPVYLEIDKRARRHQTWHRWLANTAAVAGTLAVVMGIAQLAFPEEIEGLEVPQVELVAIVLACVAVILMLLRFTGKAPWLLERHKAEWLRREKFRFLMDRAAWLDPQGLDGEIAKLRKHVAELRDTKERDDREWIDFKEWAEVGGEPLELQAGAPYQIDPEVLAQLVSYYRSKRLIYQKLYFESRANKNTQWAGMTSWLGPALFFASVLCVLAHFILEVSSHKSGASGVSQALIFLAAFLPALSAGVRSVRAAHEFERNRVRYHAKAFVFDHKDKVLQRESRTDEVLRNIHFCERVLELEHLEWARLMQEAECTP
jgi:uncharacterized membrane protein YhaH (DUF805 family)